MLMHAHQQKEVKHLQDLLQDTKESKITVSLLRYNKLEPSGFNYVSVKQGSTQWHALRVGIITASKTPYLLGLHGQKEFEHAWFCVHNKIDENKVSPKKFTNFTRGIQFEEQAVKLFEEISGAPVTTSGFFFHPTDRRYGASPDGIGQTFLLEVKTRALNSLAPLDNVTGPHIL